VSHRRQISPAAFMTGKANGLAGNVALLET
jgi:hypothetical protein